VGLKIIRKTYWIIEELMEDSSTRISITEAGTV
jgi:hypothetical protein